MNFLKPFCFAIIASAILTSAAAGADTRETIKSVFRDWKADVLTVLNRIDKAKDVEQQEQKAASDIKPAITRARGRLQGLRCKTDDDGPFSIRAHMSTLEELDKHPAFFFSSGYGAECRGGVLVVTSFDLTPGIHIKVKKKKPSEK